MPNSLVAGLGPQQEQFVQQAYSHGLQTGAALYEQQQKQQQQNQSSALARQQQLEDEQTKFQQQWALRSLTLAQEAERLRKQTGREYYKEKIGAYTQFLGDTERYWDDVSKNPWKYDEQTQQGAGKNLQFVAKKRREIANLDPGAFDDHAGIPAIQEDAPYQNVPQFSQSYVQEQQDRAANLHRLATAPDKETVADQKEAEKNQREFLAGRGNFMGTMAGYYQYNNALNSAYQGIPDDLKPRNSITPDEQLDIVQKYYSQGNDGEGKDPQLAANLLKQHDSVMQSWDKNAVPFLNKIDTYGKVPEDIQSLQSQGRSRFNGLSSPDDFHNFMTHLSSGVDYSGQDGERTRRTVGDYFDLMMGVKAQNNAPQPAQSTGSAQTTQPATSTGGQQ